MEEVETPQGQPEESLEDVTISEEPQKDWLKGLKITPFSLLALLILSGAIYAGYWHIIRAIRKPASELATPAHTSQQPSPTPLFEEHIENWKTYRNEEAATKYSLKYPGGWQISREHRDLEGESRPAYDTTTLTKGDYKIRVSQFLGGVANCLFPGDPDKEGMYRRYEDYVEMKLAGKIVRRAKPLGSQTQYVFCERMDGEFVAITSVGTVSYEVPSQESEARLREMDSIVKTLKLIR